MKVKDLFSDKEEYLEDKTLNSFPYPKAISKIDEANLKQIAKDLNVEYINMSKQSNMNKKLKELKKDFKKQVSEDDKKNAYQDIYYLFVIPFLGLIIYEFINYKQKL